MTTTSARSVGYVRVSTTEQEERGHSQREQKFSIEGHINGNPRLEIAVECGESGFYIESGSGTGIDRPIYQKMMADFAEGKWDVVVSAKLDRLHRSVKNATDWADNLKDGGGHFILLDMNIDTTTIGGELVFNIMAAVAQMEAKLTQERTRQGLRGLTRKGRWKGHPPYGYQAKKNLTQSPDDVGILEIIKEEAEVVKLIYQLHNEGYTNYAIVGELLNRGILPRGRPKVAGGPSNTIWHPSTIAGILKRREFYEGTLTLGEGDEIEMIPGLHEPILIAGQHQEEE
jgi:DNA invertase Pin-like site-specific DNA recombinase